MSKEEKKEPKPESQKVSSEQLAQAVMALAEQQKQLIGAQNQQTEFASGLAERVTRIEQSLSGLADTLKAATAGSKGEGNPLSSIVQAFVARELGGGGGFDKLAKTLLEQHLSEISPTGQRSMFKDMVTILREGIRMGKAGVSESATKALPGGEPE